MRHLALVSALCAAVLGCSDDGGPSGDGRAGDARRADSAGWREARAEAALGCVEDSKRCPTLFKIQVCKGSAWHDSLDCTNKKRGGQQCTCSPTLMFVCAYGGKECP
jgi:hypothetical protein